MSDAVLQVSDSTFDAEVLKSNIPVLVDFWAEWCGPCRMVAPVVDDIAKEYAGKLKVGKIDVDSEQELARRFGVAGIPALALFKNGEVVSHTVGARPKGALVVALSLEEHVGAPVGVE
jgi:thioredoxin 1